MRCPTCPAGKTLTTLSMEGVGTGGFAKSLQHPALIIADFCNKICH